MAYGFFSDKYRLPTQVTGSVMSEREEKRKSRIIDNQLYISLWLHGTGNGVIKEGMYLGTFTSGSSTVQLLENKPNPSLECLISQVYGYTTGTLSWVGLANSTTYYLYATIVEQATDENPTGASTREYKSIGTSFNTTGITPTDSILIATATTTASAISVNTSPSGKRYIQSVEDNTDFISGIDAYENSVFRKAVEIRGGLTSGISIYGNVVITGTGATFTVHSPTTFNDPVTFNDYIIGNTALAVRSGEDVYGDTTFRDDVTIQKALDVVRHTSLSGLSIFGNLYITGGGITTSHSSLSDMPSSTNTDHDGRYYNAGDSPSFSGVSIFGNLYLTGSGGAGGGTGTPGGNNTEVQYNNSGAFGGATGLRYNNASHLVSVNSGLDLYGDGTFHGDLEVQDTLEVEDGITNYLLLRSGIDTYRSSIFRSGIEVQEEIRVKQVLPKSGETLTVGTSGNFQFGNDNESQNVVFGGSGTIKTKYNETITIGQNSDKIRLDTSGIDLKLGYISSTPTFLQGQNTSGLGIFHDDIVVDDSIQGVVLKDAQGTPHYWRVTLSGLGALITTDIGITLPVV